VTTGVTDKGIYGGARPITGLLNAPYHQRSLVSSQRDVGISIRASTDFGITATSMVATVVELGVATDAVEQDLDASSIATYPCEGAAGVSRQLDGESPNPVPGRNLATNPLGVSLYVKIASGRTLVVTATSVTKVGGAAAVLRTTMTAANNPNQATHPLGANEAFVIGDAPFDANSTYEANITGTNNGVAFTRQFRFTTGS
jgi:hypothetical protein